ncbi:MAG: hypothetical protein PHW34_08670 [Hespellia sp.]|nr:hypothetical protein [Hespellia sp.]
MKFTGRIKECKQDFSIIESDMIEEDCEKYYQMWIEKYSSFLRDDIIMKAIYINTRVIRSRKEVVSAAQLLMEAKSNKENGCVTSYFFSCYYALFHAMLAVVYTNIEIGDDIVEITHSKLVNVFCDYYAREHKIFEPSLREFIEKCRYMREYYSYIIPYNVLFGDFDENYLEEIIKKMIMLADLHVWMISKKSMYVKRSVQYTEELCKRFLQFNVRKNDGEISEKVKTLKGTIGAIIRKYNAEPDDADYDALVEIIHNGINCQRFEEELSHDWDEAGYSEGMKPLFDEKNVYDIKHKANCFLYDLINYY